MNKRIYHAPEMNMAAVDFSDLLTTVSGQAEGDGEMYHWSELGGECHLPLNSPK